MINLVMIGVFFAQALADGALSGYAKQAQACVRDANFAKGEDEYTLEKCAELCDDLSGCKAFEFGVPHGGSNGQIPTDSCRPQDETFSAYCDGKHFNTDLYVKGSEASALSGYSKIERGCVDPVYNIAVIHDSEQTAFSCSKLCEEDIACVGFMFAFNYGGSTSPYVAGKCTTTSYSGASGCNGEDYNTDFYKRPQEAFGYTSFSSVCISDEPGAAPFTHKTPYECAKICDGDSTCAAFEYYGNHGGSGFVRGDCAPKATDGAGASCDGSVQNKNTYRPTTGEIPGYLLFEGACITDQNIALFEGRTLGQCAEICNNMAEACVGFEFGHAYGGGGLKYKAGDCQPQSAPADFSKCNGRFHNLDFYIKKDNMMINPPSGGFIAEYAHFEKACVLGFNIQIYQEKTPEQCAELCSRTPGCVAFEFGVDHGGDYASKYSAGQCQPQIWFNKAHPDYTECDGERFNLDLYMRTWFEAEAASL